MFCLPPAPARLADRLDQRNQSAPGADRPPPDADRPPPDAAVHSPHCAVCGHFPATLENALMALSPASSRGTAPLAFPFAMAVPAAA